MSGTVLKGVTWYLIRLLKFHPVMKSSVSLNTGYVGKSRAKTRGK